MNKEIKKDISNYSYTKGFSEAINWLRFPLIFLIIMLHCYSVQRLEGNHEVFFKVIYPFSLWLGETGVPGFFFISGYLFFISKKTYWQKIETRVHTLLVPYLLWNSMLLILYFATYFIGYPQEINGRNIADYQLFDYIRLFWDRGTYDKGNFVPLLCPLWYIRNLLIMSILSPIIFILIKYTRELFLFAIMAWWLFTYHNGFIPQTILFFSLGAYFSIYHINPLKTITTNKKLFFALFCIFAIGDIRRVIDMIDVRAGDLARHGAIRHHMINQLLLIMIDVRIRVLIKAHQLLGVAGIDDLLDRFLLRHGIQITHDQDIRVAIPP